MVLRKLSQTLMVSLAFMVATFSSGLLQPAVAHATATPRVDSKAVICKYSSTPGERERPQTIIVVDRKDDMVIGSEFTDAQELSVVIGFQNPSDPKPALSECPGYVAPTVSASLSAEDICLGDGALITVNNTGNTALTFNLLVEGNPTLYQGQTLAVGASTDLTFTAAQVEGFGVGTYNIAVQNGTTILASTTVDVKDCEEDVVSASVVAADICVGDGASVTVTNTGTGELTFDLIANSITAESSVTLQAGASQIFTYSAAEVASVVSVAGTYTLNVVSSGNIVGSGTITLEDCPALPEAPTANAMLIPCTPNSGSTDKVSVRVYNTDDGTNATVTYTIVLGGVTKTVAVPDGENRNVEFGDLTAGTSYSATVTGTDGTVTTNTVVAASCGRVLGDSVCVPTNTTYTNNDSKNITVVGNAIYEFTIDGLKLSTPGSSDKVYGYYAKSMKLSDVDQISYQTYRYSTSTGSSLQIPSFQIGVDVNGSAAGGFTTLVFEPIYTYGNSAIQNDTWQLWDAYSAGSAKWWSTNSIQSAPNRDTFTAWKDIVAANPNAQVLYYGFSQGSGNPGITSKVNALSLDCTVINYGLTGGQGGGTIEPPVVPPTTTTPGQTLGTSIAVTPTPIAAAVLPAILPATGGIDSPFMVIVASILAYGAAYFLQGRRLIARKEAIQA